MDFEKILDILKIDNMTTPQKKAVLEEKRPILVSASAGSGKTFVLTTRYVYKTLAFNSKKMLVLTFAKTAANEMFCRILNMISKLLENDPNNKRLQNIKNSISANLITTIDSFCHNILKENFAYCDLSPNFKIVSNLEIAYFKNELLDEILETELLQDEKKFQQFCSYFSLSGTTTLKENILKIYEKSRTMPFPKNYLKSLLDCYEKPPNFEEGEFLKEIKEEILNKLQEIKNMLYSSIYFLEDITTKNICKPVLEQTILKIKNLEKEVIDSKSEKLKNALENFKFENFPRYDKNKNNFDRELVEEIKKLYINPAKRIIASLKDLIVSEKEYILDFKKQKNIAKKLIEITLKFTKKLNLKKKKQNILEFSDLYIKTIELLATCSKKNEINLTEFGKKISKDFEEILVDEFQDINQSQSLIIKILSDNNKKLFMVGDLKQSIYAFRDADTTIFLNRIKEYEKNPLKGTIINLNKNFRSRKEITNSVNFLFGQIMSYKFGGLDYEKTEYLISNSTLKQEQKYATQLHILKNNNEKDKLEFELSHVVKIIKTMLDEKFKIEENGLYRNCEPKDFAVLFRSGKKSMELLGEKLKELNINFTSFSDVNFMQSYEISLITSLLKIINNPFLDISFCAIATSPMFYFTNEELLKIRLKNKNKPFFIAFKNSKNKKCRNLIFILEKLIKKSKELDLEKLIIKIYNMNFFLKIFTKIEYDEIKQKNLELFLDIAKKYEYYEKFGIPGFLEYLEKINSEKTEIKISNNSTLKNAVNILTIHKSKGLEFPIVILPLTNKKFNEQDFSKPMLISSKFGLTLKHSDEKKLIRYNTFTFNAAVCYEKNKLKEEELRLLYVGLTRAKEKLILTATCDEKKLTILKNQKFQQTQLPYTYCRSKNSFFYWIFSSFFRNKSCKISNKIINFENENFDCEILIKQKFEEKTIIKKANQQKININKNMLKKFKRKLNSNIIDDVLLSKISVTDIIKQKNSKYQSQLKLKNPNFDIEEKPTYLQKGTAMHNFLQYVNFKNAEKNLNLEIERMVKKEFITKNQAQILDRKKLKNFFSSITYKLIKTATKVQREKYFLCEIESEKIFKKIKNKKILLQGIVDCIIEKNNKLILIDYKTDALDEKNLVLHYENQLKYYKYAIEKLTSKPVIFSIIHSLYLNKAIKI